MRKGILLITGVLVSVMAWASEERTLLHVDINLHDKARLQRGARLYMNYCSGCHSLKYMRYNRMAKDLGLTTFTGAVDEDLLYNNLVFTEAKIHDPIEIAMPPVGARKWFGAIPPDLSLTARLRGPEWIYTYLKSFYEDATRPFGANNLLIPGVAMPNILEPLQGVVTGVPIPGDKHGGISHLVLVKQGEMTTYQFDSALEDIVNFLVYVGEPAKMVRYQLGKWVLLYMLILLVVVYRLKKIYWKRLHK